MAISCAVALGFAGTHGGAATAAAPTVTSMPPAQLTVVGETAGIIPWNHPLQLRVLDGTLDQVAVVDENGVAVAGGPGADGASWQSNDTLVPETAYRVNVSVVDLHHRSDPHQLVLRASDSASHLTATITPGDDDVVGVGMPIV